MTNELNLIEIIKILYNNKIKIFISGLLSGFIILFFFLNQDRSVIGSLRIELVNKNNLSELTTVSVLLNAQKKYLENKNMIIDSLDSNKYLNLYYENLLIEYDKYLLTYDNTENDLKNFTIMNHELIASEFFPAITIHFKTNDIKSGEDYLSSLLQTVDKNVSSYIIGEISSVKNTIGSVISIANEIEINKNILELKRVNKERILNNEIDKVAVNNDIEKSKSEVPLNLYVLGGNKNRESYEKTITYLKNRGKKLNINNHENDNVRLSKQISTNYISIISKNLDSIVLEGVNVVKYDLNKATYNEESFMRIYLYTLIGLFLGITLSSLSILIRHSLIKN